METHNTQGTFYTRRAFKVTLLLLAASLAVKLPLLPLKWGIIAGDGIKYVSTAQLISQMDLKAAFSIALPFYPLLITIFHAIGSSWATSAIMVSFLCGWLAVIPFYLLTARIFDEKVAFVSSFFFILSPNINFVSTAIGSDAAFMLFFILGIWFLWLANEEGGLLYWSGFIVFAIMATLARNAGVALFPLFLLSAVHSHRRNIKGLSKILIIAALCVGGVVALLALYYFYAGVLPAKFDPLLNILTDLSYFKAERITAELKLAEKTTYMGKYFDFFEMARHYLHIIYMMGIVDLLIRACGYAIFPFVAIGLYRGKKGWDGYGRSYLLTIVLLFIAINYIFLLKNNFTEARYLMPASLALFPIGGQGYIKLEGYLKERFSINSRVVAVIVVLLVVMGSAYKFNSRRKDALTYQNLQDSISWVKTNMPAGAMIATNDPAIPVSAERAYINTECSDLNECIKLSTLRSSGVDYIVYREVDKRLEHSAYRPEKVFYGNRFDIYIFKAGRKHS